MLNVNRLECQVTLIAPVFLHTLEMEQSAQVCIHRMITVVTITQNSASIIILQSRIPVSLHLVIQMLNVLEKVHRA